MTIRRCKILKQCGVGGMGWAFWAEDTTSAGRARTVFLADGPYRPVWLPWDLRVPLRYRTGGTSNILLKARLKAASES